jgi:hypothetical protein
MGRGALAGLLAALVIGGATAGAFVLEGPMDRPWPAVEDVDRAARWDYNADPRAEGGAPGLGGGIEVSLDDSLCTELNFLDNPPCAAIKAAVMAAANRWGEGHPILRFVDVSDRIAVAPQGSFAASDGQGAEVDVFAASPAQFGPFRARGVAAMTVYYFDTERRPRLTNTFMADRSLGTLTAADVRLSTSACYYIDEADRRFGCAHFPSLMMHEFAHVIGVDHPDETPDRNLDTDDNPANAMPVNCEAPRQGLQVSLRFEPAATSVGQLWGANAWRRGLTFDDVAARDALYPHCGISLVERGTGERWGAFARSDDGATLSVIGAASESDARARINAACARRGEPCATLAAFTACFAYAEGASGAGAGATGPAIPQAQARALAMCGQEGDQACRVREAFCAFE